VIANPLASKKTTKKLHKLVKKASSAKIVKRGKHFNCINYNTILNTTFN